MNFLATLGWNDGTEQEIFTPSELINVFDIEKVGRSGAQFNDEKLDWVNREHLKALSYEDQSVFLTSLANSVTAVSVFSAPINTLNSNFQQSPLIVPTFYKMAMNNQNNAISALIIGNNNPHFTDASLNKDDILTVKGSDEQFIPIQQILNNKVKMIFNDYPEQAGNFSIYNKKEWLENISFNYNRTESNLAAANENIVSNYKTTESITSFFDTLQTDRTDNKIWKWFVIFALLFLLTEMAIIRFVK